MTKAIQDYMLTIFNCSYQALQEWKEVDENYPKWLRRHQFFSGRINRAFIKCYKDSVRSWPKIKGEIFQKQELVDLMQGILQEHLKYRFSIYKRNKKQTKKTFICKSIVKSYSLLALSLVRSMKYLAKCYTPPSRSDEKMIVIVKDFPSHGFSISERPQKISCSFGDYLKKRLNKKKISILSIDEYTRPSKAKEKQAKWGGIQNKTKRVKELQREVLKSNISILSFFSGFASLLNYLIRERKQLARKYDLWFLVIHRACCSKAFSELCKHLKATGSTIYKNYFLGFSGAIGYPMNTLPEPIEFLYAANVYNPPHHAYNANHSDTRKKRKYKLRELTLSTLTLSRSAAGFSDLPKEINVLKRIINQNCNVSLPVRNLRCEPFAPANLGFEYENKLPEIRNTSGIIAVFDTPPDSREGQIGRSIFGDLTHDFFVVSQFLEDIVEVASTKGFFIFHKPKYSFENYTSQYRNLVYKLRDKYKDSYHLISPYNSLAPLLTNCRASFSFIGSSTYVISKKYCSYSFAYIPNSIIALADNNNKDIIAGRTELSTRLDKIRKRTRYVKSRR